MSWNEAAEMKLSVSSDALVMPSRTGVGFGGFAALFRQRLRFLSRNRACRPGRPRGAGVARIGDLHLAEHLADDDLDVLVVDLDALEAINLLHFVDQVFLQLLRPADIEDFVRSAPDLR